MPKPTDIQNANMVRKRKVANDRFYTPRSLVNIHLGLFYGLLDNMLIYEPFRGKGAYYNQFPEYFPTCTYDWSEIDDGQDFFDYTGRPDIIISNPPFSILDRVFERCFRLRPLVISFVLNQHAVTPCRLRTANEAGYYVMHYHLTRVDRWFGVACILTLSREIRANIIGFDCIKHCLESPESETHHPSPPSQPLDVSSNTPTDNSLGHISI